MSVTEPTTDPEAEGGSDSAVIQKLREQANRTQAAENENVALKREMAFDRAGVPTEGPASYFRKAYDGDITPEAIRAEAETAGLLSPAAPAVPQTEVTDLGAVSSSMAGGAPPPVAAPADKIREIGQDGLGDYNALIAEAEASGLTGERVLNAFNPFGMAE